MVSGQVYRAAQLSIQRSETVFLPIDSTLRGSCYLFTRVHLTRSIFRTYRCQTVSRRSILNYDARVSRYDVSDVKSLGECKCAKYDARCTFAIGKAAGQSEEAGAEN